jgi:hypothetical protein
MLRRVHGQVTDSNDLQGGASPAVLSLEIHFSAVGVYGPSQMIAEISTCRMSFLGRRGAGPSFPTGRTQSSDTLRYSFELLGRFDLRCGRSKAQEPSREGAEDQAEAQRLPKMAARNTGGHQRIRQ